MKHLFSTKRKEIKRKKETGVAENVFTKDEYMGIKKYL